MEIKCRNRYFKLNKDDEILYNGKCYSLITQTYKRGFDTITPVIAVLKAEKMIKEGVLVLGRIGHSGWTDTKLQYYVLNNIK